MVVLCSCNHQNDTAFHNGKRKTMTTECLALKRYQFCITISAIFAVYLFSNATTFAIVEIDQFDHSRCQLDLQMPTGAVERVNLSGSSTMAVYFEGTTEGSASDDDGDSLDEVQTEMTALNLDGYSPSLGPLRMILSSSEPTTGQMEETANNTPGVLDVPPFTPVGTIDSFFDVFLEIEMGGQTFHTIQPVRWSSVLTHKPPGPADIYENLADIQLYDAAGNPTGFYLGATTYHPEPCVRCSDFDESGATNMPDLRKFVNNWLWTESIGDTYNASDLNCDWVVNFFDFAVFASYWLQACP